MPARRARAVEAVEDVRQVLVGDPGAVVAHRDLALPDRRPRPARRAGSTWPRCRAGCATARSIVDGAPWTTDSSKSVSNSMPGRLRRVRSIASAATRSSRTSWPARPPPRAWPRARARSARRSARSSRRSARPGRASSCSRVSGGSSFPRASTSMFVFRLVSGVRSSCEASATSCRCARLESSSAASIVLKLGRAGRARRRRSRSTRSAARGRASR